MKRKFNMWMKIIGLELLVIFFFTVNGILVTISEPTNEFLKYLGIVPLALGIMGYLIITKKWEFYFSKNKLLPVRRTMLFSAPLVLIVILLFIGNGGIESTPINMLFLVLATQIAVVAFIEEMVFRGFMMDLLSKNNFKVAVFVSSGLFAITHSLQLLSGQSLEDTLLQIAYAFFIGMALSLLRINNQSIIIAIVFHGLNNFIIISSQNTGSSLYTYVIVSILILYTIYLWVRAVRLSKANIL